MKTKSSPATAAPVAPAAGLKRINLAGIATTAPAAKAAKTYPELADPDGQMAVASSVEAKAGDKLVRVGFSNSYRGTNDDAAILRVTGESRNRWDRLRQTALPAQPHFAGRQTGRNADQRSRVLQAELRAQD